MSKNIIINVTLIILWFVLLSVSLVTDPYPYNYNVKGKVLIKNRYTDSRCECNNYNYIIINSNYGVGYITLESEVYNTIKKGSTVDMTLDRSQMHKGFKYEFTLKWYQEVATLAISAVALLIFMFARWIEL